MEPTLTLETPGRPERARMGWAGGRGWLVAGLTAALLAGGWRVRSEGVWVSGITEPITDITMAFSVVGILGTRPFEEGAAVQRGQVVAGLEKRLEELEVERKRLARDLAKTELGRLQALAERNALSVIQEDIDKLQASYNIAVVDHQFAEEQLRRRLLMSPVDGYIAEYYKDVGEACDEQRAPVVRIVDTRRCYFVANVEARASHTLSLGKRVPLEIESGPQTVAIEGQVSYISPVVDPASGLLTVKAIFNNAQGALRPGVAGRLRIE